MTEDPIIAVFSDTHGNREALDEAVLFAREKYLINRMIHLGDGVFDGERAAKARGIGFTGIRGNEDYTSAYPEFGRIDMGPWPILCLHGFQYEINPFHTEKEWENHFSLMSVSARRHGAAVVLFGHSHLQMLERRNGVIFCNPGDMYRGAEAAHGFAVLMTTGRDLNVVLLRKKKGAPWLEVRGESFSADDLFA